MVILGIELEGAPLTSFRFDAVCSPPHGTTQHRSDKLSSGQSGSLPATVMPGRFHRFPHPRIPFRFLTLDETRAKPQHTSGGFKYSPAYDVGLSLHSGPTPSNERTSRFGDVLTSDTWSAQ